MSTSSQSNNAPMRMQMLAKALEPSADIIQNCLQIEQKQAYLLFLKSTIDGRYLQNNVIKPFFELSSLDHFAGYIQSLPITEDIPSDNQLLVKLTQGYVLLAVQNQYYLLDLKYIANNEVLEASMEPTIHGPQKGLSESLETNLNLIRQRYHQPDLIIETLQMKDASNQSIAVLYQKDKASDKLLNMMRERLKDIDVGLIQSAGDLSYYINNKKASLFPTTLITERPDRIVRNISGGKVIVLVDGSPHAIIAPIVFFDFMYSMEDNYHSYWIVLMTQLLRYSGLFTCIVLPSFYVAVTSFNPDVFRTELALTIAASRIGVPYPSFIEVLLMLVFIELLTEASIRLPTAISATATTVGGLILGTAVVEAALASNIMIIVVALVAISTFVIPINELDYAVRVTRVMLLFYTTIFGLAGLAIGFLGLLMFLANKESFEEPYFRIFWKGRQKELKAEQK